MRRLFVGHSLPFLSAVYNFFLFRSVLCLLPLLVPNDCPSVKYASGYFSILSALACLLACPVLPNRSLHALFRISSFLSRVAVSPGLDTLPSISPLSPLLATITTTNRRHYVTRIDAAPLRDECIDIHQSRLDTDVVLTSRHYDDRTPVFLY
jgi:hypothetical protein